MGHNTRDRQLEHQLRMRSREVARLDAKCLAARVVISANRAFNDDALVMRVLDRVHAERGVGRLYYLQHSRAVYIAAMWSRSRGRPLLYLAARDEAWDRVTGAISFGLVDPGLPRLLQQGVPVWRPMARRMPLPSPSTASPHALH